MGQRHVHGQKLAKVHMHFFYKAFVHVSVFHCKGIKAPLNLTHAVAGSASVEVVFSSVRFGTPHWTRTQMEYSDRKQIAYSITYLTPSQPAN